MQKRDFVKNILFRLRSTRLVIIFGGGYLITKIKEKLYNFFFRVGCVIGYIIAWIIYVIFYFMFKRFAKKVRDEIENTSGRVD